MILQNDFQKQWDIVGEDVLNAINTTCKSGWLILGQQVRSFESSFAEYCGVEFAATCGNGLDAITMGLQTLGISEGDKVITTPLSAFATTLAILRLGGIPIFIDTDENGLLDLEKVGRYLSYNRDVKYMVPVHLYGIPLDLIKLRELKNKYRINIVEDCAQSFLAKYDNMPVGSVGDVSAFSFYPTKNLGAIGDGGAVITNSNDVYKTIKSIRNYGESSKYHHEIVGINSRLDEIQAAVLNVMLSRSKSNTEKRRSIAKRYSNEITNPIVRQMRPNKYSNPVWHLYPITLTHGSRQHFISYMKKNDIQIGIHYPIPIPSQTALKNKSFIIADNIEACKSICDTVTSIPIHPLLNIDEVDRIIDVINKYRP